MEKLDRKLIRGGGRGLIRILFHTHIVLSIVVDPDPHPHQEMGPGSKKIVGNSNKNPKLREYNCRFKENQRNCL